MYHGLVTEEGIQFASETPKSGQSKRLRTADLVVALKSPDVPGSSIATLFSRISKTALQESLDDRVPSDHKILRDVAYPALGPGKHGLLVSCSCSVHLDDERMAAIIEESLSRFVMTVKGHVLSSLSNGPVTLAKALQTSIQEVGPDVFSFTWKQRLVVQS